MKALRSISLLPLAVAVAIFIHYYLSWGPNYLIGGDDSGLYYLVPNEFFRHFSLTNIVENNFSGFDTQDAYSRFSPLLFLLKLFSGTQINVQGALMGLNAIAGFLSVYALTAINITPYGLSSSLIRVSIGLLYIYSPYLLILYDQRLFAYLVISAFPTTVYLLIHGIVKDRPSLIVFAAIFYSIVGGLLVNIPWFSASWLVFTPLLFVSAMPFPYRFFRYFVLFAILVGLMNCYAYSNILIQYFGKYTVTFVDVYRNRSFISGSLGAVKSVSALYPLLTSIYQELDVSRIAFPSYATVLHAGIWIIIGGAGLFVGCSRVSRHIRAFYLASIISVLLAVLLFQPNIGIWSREVFAWLIGNVPLFVMFRNMFGKFAHTVALQIPLALMFSYIVLRDRFKSVWLQLLILILVFPIVISYIQGYSHWFQRSQTHQERISGEFNEDFLQLASWLRQQRFTSSAIYFPLNQDPSRVYIEDKIQRGHYYIGTSPFFILSNLNVFTGLYDFPETYIPGIRTEIPKIVKGREYEKLLSLYRLLDIKYIIWDKQHPENSIPWLKDWAFGDTAFFNALDEDFRKNIFGKKLSDFGNRYSVYEIKDASRSATIYLSDSLSASASTKLISFNKLTASTYTVDIPSGFQGYLLLLKPFSKGWRMLDKYDVPLNIEHVPAFGFLNAWNITPENGPHVWGQRIKLWYEPQQYAIVGVWITVAGYILSVCLLGYFSIRRFKK